MTAHRFRVPPLLQLMAMWLLSSLLLVGAYADDMPNSASSPEKEAIAVLTKIIQADFDAVDNGGQRIDNVAFTRARARASYGPKLGHYMLDWDAFEVAAAWRLVGEKKLSETLVECSVEFRVVGRARGGGTEEKGIAPISNVQPRVVIYRVRKTSEGWKVIDPPIPVVGIDSLERFYQTKRERLSSQINSMRDKGLEPYENLVKGVELATLRLNDLEALRK